jgi:hypothetical protein
MRMWIVVPISGHSGRGRAEEKIQQKWFIFSHSALAAIVSHEPWKTSNDCLPRFQSLCLSFSVIFSKNVSFGRVLGNLSSRLALYCVTYQHKASHSRPSGVDMLLDVEVTVLLLRLHCLLKLAPHIGHLENINLTHYCFDDTSFEAEKKNEFCSSLCTLVICNN